MILFILFGCFLSSNASSSRLSCRRTWPTHPFFSTHLFTHSSVSASLSPILHFFIVLPISPLHFLPSPYFKRLQTVFKVEIFLMTLLTWKHFQQKPVANIVLSVLEQSWSISVLSSSFGRAHFYLQQISLANLLLHWHWNKAAWLHFFENFHTMLFWRLKRELLSRHYQALNLHRSTSKSEEVLLLSYLTWESRSIDRQSGLISNLSR